MAVSIYDVGWWIESDDDELYGPASRDTLRSFLSQGVISTNTLVQHCTQTESRPVADHPGMLDGIELAPTAPITGDRLAEVWPGPWWTEQRLQLARGSLRCVRHKRAAILFCVRCEAPYCERCEPGRHRRPCHFCPQCLGSLDYRRLGSFLLDASLFQVTPTLAVGFVVRQMVGSGFVPQSVGLLLFLSMLLAGSSLLVWRDALFHGAGPGKRLAGLRVVQARDGTTPLSHGQAFVRDAVLAIPFPNLILGFVECIVMGTDPLRRRLGDRWAGTRVIDTPTKLKKVRARTRRRLAKKGLELLPHEEMTMEQYARIAE